MEVAVIAIRQGTGKPKTESEILLGPRETRLACRADAVCCRRSVEINVADPDKRPVLQQLPVFDIGVLRMELDEYAIEIDASLERGDRQIQILALPPQHVGVHLVALRQ